MIVADAVVKMYDLDGRWCNEYEVVHQLTQQQMQEDLNLISHAWMYKQGKCGNTDFSFPELPGLQASCGVFFAINHHMKPALFTLACICILLGEPLPFIILHKLSVCITAMCSQQKFCVT